MSRRHLLAVFIPALIGLAPGAGCNSEVQEEAAQAKLHDTSNFTSAQLNAPLGTMAKAKGAQVAPPPVR